MVTDPLADMIIRLQNAARVGKRQVVMPFSNLKLALAEALRRGGFVKSPVKKGKKTKKLLEVELVCDEKGAPVLRRVERVSKTSRRVYHSVSDIHPLRRGGRGVTVYTTSRGVLTDREAKREKVGGEALCRVW